MDIPNIDDGNLDDEVKLEVFIDKKDLNPDVEVERRRGKALVYVADNEGELLIIIYECNSFRKMLTT